MKNQKASVRRSFLRLLTPAELSEVRARQNGKRTQRQDWLVLLGFNHLFAGLEAFVATHLHDFPSDVKFQVTPLPGGGLAAGASVPFRIR